LKLVLLVGDECNICEEAKEAFMKKFHQEVANNEAEIVNLDENEQYQQLWMENELPLAPVVVLTNDKGKMISSIPPEELLEYIPQAKDDPVPESSPEPENTPLTNPE